MVRSPSPKHRATPDPLAAKVGARIRKLRQASDMTFDAFVEEVGLGRGYISELERGLVVPSITVIDQVARALGVSVGDLVLVEDSPRAELFALTHDLPVGVLRRLVKDLRKLRADREKR